MRIFILLIFSGFNVFSQGLVPIQLDRPDQTECPFITPRGYIQIENGFTIEKDNFNQKNFSIPSILWKYGINDRFELRLITEYAIEKNEFKNQKGLIPITLGFKTALFEENGFIPETSFIGHISSSKLGSKAFHTENISPAFRFTMQHSLSNKVALAYNLGAEWGDESAEVTYIYTLTTGFSLTNRLGCYTEMYGFLSKNLSSDHRIDAGFTYLLNNNMMADISGGLGLSQQSAKNYISFGISYRFNTK
jgi:Putative MetA-pathway of phenol degradation